MRTLTILFLMLCLGASAASIPGTIVAAKITTGNTANTFSIGDTVEMGGTPKQVADITARDAITTDRRTEGMTCWVISEGNEYRLVGGIANADWVLSGSLTNVFGTLIVTNLFVTNLYATNIYVSTNLVGDLTVTNAITNLSLTAKTVLQADANRVISSIPNGAGGLVNDGAGNFSWNPAITGIQFVTNDGFFLHLWGTATNLNSPWALSNDGELFEGTNALAGSLAPGFHVFGAVAFSDSGQVPTQFFDILSAKDNTVAQYGLINGAAGESPASASWSLLSGDPSGSTNNLGLQAHSGSAWFTAKVDTTNRAQLDYTGIWEAQGFKDDSGSPGMLVAYGASGRLVPTNAVFTSNLYSTNISVSNIYATNIYVSVITNVDMAYITNLYVSTNFTTNLFVTYANITNLYVDIAYITNLYVNVAYITNLTVVTNVFNTSKGGTVFVTNLFVSATNFLGELTVTNGITNLSLTANTVLEADANRRISSIPNAAGALTNNAAGVVGWYNNFLDKSGGTSTGPQLTDSATTNNPAGNEFVTGNWVRGLLNNGFFEYVSTNIISGTNANSPDQFLYAFQSTIPQPAIRAWPSQWITNNGYIGSVSTTNTFLSLAGGVVVNSYIALSGSGSPNVSLKPEIYLSTDRSNWYGDFDAAPQALVPGVTQLYAFAVSFPAQTATNTAGFYIQRRYKVTSKAGTPTVTFLIGTNVISGTNNAAHIAINAAAVNSVLPGVVAGQSTSIRTNGLAYAVDVTGALTNNIITLGTNHFAGTVTTSTNLVWGPDFAVEESCLSTNAAFTFAAPVGVDTAGKTVQWTLVNVTNTTAAAVLVTAPANCHPVGTMYVTNWTCFWFQCYANKITNCFGIPVF